VLITSPACASTYDVPDALLKQGRAVRCSRCAGQWVPALDDAPPEPDLDPWPSEAPPQIGPSAMELLAAQQPQAAVNWRLRVAWLASVVVLGLMVAGGYIWRSELMSTWPPSTRLYATLGLAHPVDHH
jgi:predicted Zn finger-like uncharacterized protein